jgi:hypothetical protein
MTELAAHSLLRKRAREEEPIYVGSDSDSETPPPAASRTHPRAAPNQGGGLALHLAPPPPPLPRAGAAYAPLPPPPAFAAPRAADSSLPPLLARAGAHPRAAAAPTPLPPATLGSLRDSKEEGGAKKKRRRLTAHTSRLSCTSLSLSPSLCAVPNWSDRFDVDVCNHNGCLESFAIREAMREHRRDVHNLGRKPRAAEAEAEPAAKAEPAGAAEAEAAGAAEAEAEPAAEAAGAAEAEPAGAAEAEPAGAGAAEPAGAGAAEPAGAGDDFVQPRASPVSITRPLRRARAPARFGMHLLRSCAAAPAFVLCRRNVLVLTACFVVVPSGTCWCRS